MKPGDLSGGAGSLEEALKVLDQRWQRVADAWNDQQRRDFETRYVTPLMPQVRDVLERMARLSQLFGQARHDCT